MTPADPPPRTSIDLNADLAEGCPWDAELLRRVTSASLCCGAHAGDPDSIRATIEAARSLGVVVGAHPGFPDREHFGRLERPVGRVEAERLIVDQVADLAALASEFGVPIRFLKPHGALYNQAQRDPEVAAGAVAAAAALGLPILGQPGGAVESAARGAGVRFVAEGFADRRYRPDGRLVPRGEPGAVLKEPEAIASQVLGLLARGLDTLCLHGDSSESVALADLVLATLARAGVPTRPFV